MDAINSKPVFQSEDEKFQYLADQISAVIQQEQQQAHQQQQYQQQLSGLSVDPYTYWAQYYQYELSIQYSNQMYCNDQSYYTAQPTPSTTPSYSTCSPSALKQANTSLPSDRLSPLTDYSSRESGTPDSVQSRSGRQHPLMPHTNVDAVPFHPNIFLGECERWNLHVKARSSEDVATFGFS
ncbi:unnamed protein product [Bursaphelenchus okinawaensis]|uniref:Uncharacterized protein n=1 Tax=Bursaphelenchus okinawaensis TaxID=465554 RepID=A0A811JRG6_9BILA|nr:unnamed protein product [Bursaphelenchus okinawaensis]CAG9080157.1 unnamed protein product [Bursaphelenchus okinawaensis]